jgi:hypothetical protein
MSFVQGQFSDPHCLVTVLQHWLAKQSACEWQHALHDPPWQHWEEGQSESAQHVAVVHEPPQHFWPPGHWASVVHAQFCEPHVCAAIPQHWLARQSLFEQQLPATHRCKTAEKLSAVPALLPSDCATLPSVSLTVPSAGTT